MDMNNFLDALKSSDTDKLLVDLCRRSVLHGTPAIFQGREDDFYSFRKRIAEKFDVNFYEVYIVGSAKMGFSPHKRKVFDLDSDIDVAIVSRKLFDDILDEIQGFQMELRAARAAVTKEEMIMYHSFLEYVAMGWIRPDKLPISFKMKAIKDDWFRFFSSISYGKSEVGNYKVSAGVYKDYKYLENYSMSGIRDLRKSLAVRA